MKVFRSCVILQMQLDVYSSQMRDNEYCTMINTYEVTTWGKMLIHFITLCSYNQFPSEYVFKTYKVTVENINILRFLSETI